MGVATRLTHKAKQEALKKDIKDKIESATKVLEGVSPPKPENTIDTVETADKWKAYYHEKYKKKKAELKPRDEIAKPPTKQEFDPIEYSKSVAKEELRDYVSSEAMKMAMKSIFS